MTNEPMTILCIATFEKGAELQRECRRRGCTVVLTTHRPKLIGAVDRILVLRDGVQMRFGPARTVLGEVQQLRAHAHGA